MAIFSFFGIFIEATNTKRTHLNVGGFKNQLHVQLHSGTPMTLLLAFDGYLPHARASFTFELPVRQDDDNILHFLAGGRSLGKARMLIGSTLADGRPIKTTTLSPDVNAENARTFDIIDESSGVKNWLLRCDMFFPSDYVRFDSRSWRKGTLVRFDLRSEGTISLHPRYHRTPVKLILKDRFQENRLRGRRNAHEQRLTLRFGIAHKADKHLRVIFDADNHFLLLNSDVFDTTQFKRQEHDTDNPLMYQYAVVNGQLEWHIDFNATDDARFYWLQRRELNAVPVAVLLFRLSDEYGNPIAFVPTRGYFAIGYRYGTTSDVQDKEPSHQDWARSNLSACIITDYRQGEIDREDGSLLSLDPIAIYGRERTSNQSHSPHWLTHDAVQLLASAPTEIHGIADGVSLRHVSVVDDTEITALQRVEQPAYFRAVRYSDERGDTTYFFPELSLSDVSYWRLCQLVEEKQIYQTVSDPLQDAVTPVYFRVSEPKAAGKNQKPKTVTIPVTDTSFALANLSGRGRQRRSSTTTEPEIIGNHPIVAEGVKRLQNIDRQMTGENPTVFKKPTLSGFAHVDGFMATPPSGQPYDQIIDRPPAYAESLLSTKRQNATLAASKVSRSAAKSSELSALGATPRTLDSSYTIAYIHGGDDKTRPKLEKQIQKTARTLAGNIQKFEQFWASAKGLSTELTAARKALREALAGSRISNTSSVEDRFILAFDIFERGYSITGIEHAEAIKNFLAELTLSEFEELWLEEDEGSIDDDLLVFFDHLWAPPSVELFRRTVDLLFDGALSDSSPLKQHIQVLRDFFVEFDEKVWRDALKNTLSGLLTQLKQGTDGYFADVINMWRNVNSPLLNSLKAKYGPELTDDVYRDILQTADDAQKLVDIIVEQLELPLERLADLNTQPPEYLFFTKRFKVTQSSGNDQALNLWNHIFDLCKVGSSISWNFLLDNDSSVIVKLNSERSLPSILRDIETSYRTEQRPNPLGIAVEESDKSAGSPVESLIEHLHSDLLRQDWQGVVIVNPKADISQDNVLRDLAGFEYITAQYVAIGGDKPSFERADLADLDIYARILKEEREPKADTGNEKGDVNFAMMKFDVTIKHTQIEAGEIVFRLDLINLWGRDREWPDGAPKAIYIRGTLPNQKKQNSRDASPPQFEFAAWFDPIYTINIDLAFIKNFVFRSIKVARYNGRTALAIDGTVNIQANGGELPLSFGEGEQSTLDLKDFRILLPSFSGDSTLNFGHFRKLNFDFPSVRFKLPKPRAINFLGIEFIPQRIGFIREIGDALKEVEQRFRWLDGKKFPTARDFLFSYMEFSVDFGKLPQFGGSSLDGLKFNMLLGVSIKEAKFSNVALGISGLEAKEISIDLFRLLKLEIDDFYIGEMESLDPKDDSDSPRVLEEVSAVMARKIDLKILDWSPLPDGAELDLLMLHPNINQEKNAKGQQRKGMLLSYSDEPNTDNFVRIYWFVLGHNVRLPEKVINHLLSKKKENNGKSLLKNLLVKEKKEEEEKAKRVVKKIHVQVLDEESWLAGISFGLGDIVDRCSLVLHDGYYYGINLAAKWVPLVFGQDSIELAYIPGPVPEMDRFRTNLRIPGLDMLGNLKSGEFGLEWGVNWDFLFDVGYPWRTPTGYDWFRSFSIIVGIYEAKFGYFFEKGTELTQTGEKALKLSTGVGFYLGYGFAFNGSIVWVRAGIGVFAILQGSLVLENANPKDLAGNPALILRASMVSLEVRGVIGIFAYGEAGLDVWILSARFRVALQAAITSALIYTKNAPCVLSYDATLSASYSASVRVGCGFLKWTFRVSGTYSVGVAGRALLS